MLKAGPRTRIVLAGEPAQAVARQPSLLSLHSPEFLCTTHGGEAWALIGRYRPRVAILTDELPGVAGTEILGLVRGTPELRRTSLILLAGRPTPGRYGRHANAIFDYAAGLDVEAVAERAERLLCVQPRVTARASVCLARRVDGRTAGSFAHSVNLSESGMLLQSRDHLAPGESLWLHFVLPQSTELIAARGRVVRRAVEEAPAAEPQAPAPRHDCYGVEFTTLLPDDQLRIRGFVAERLSPAA